MRVLFFGDSIVYGAWDTEGGWVDRLKRNVHKSTLQTNGSRKSQLINLGIGGNNSAGLLSRLKNEIEARRSASWPFAFVVCIGTNDERSINGVVETSPEQFESNMRQICEMLKAISDKVLILGIPPLGMDTVVFKDQEYSNERIVQYDAIVQRVASEQGLKYIPLNPAFENSVSKNLFSDDNIHPNDTGHKLIADTVEPHLMEMLK